MGVKREWPTITAMTAFFVVADRSHHCYVSTSGNVRSGLILKKTRPTLFPMFQEYFRIIISHTTLVGMTLILVSFFILILILFLILILILIIILATKSSSI